MLGWQDLSMDLANQREKNSHEICALKSILVL